MIASNKIKYNFFWKLLFLIVSPSLAYVLFNLSSLSVGLVLVSAVILLFNNFEIYIKDIKGLPLIVVHVFFTRIRFFRVAPTLRNTSLT